MQYDTIDALNLKQKIKEKKKLNPDPTQTKREPKDLMLES